jgi:hypothetical protein
MNRLFPRYNIEKIQASLHMGNLHGGPFKIVNVSLTGLQIKGPHKLIFRDFNQVKLSLKDDYQLNVYQVWWREEQGEFMSGLKLKLLEQDHFEKWFKFIKAIHMLKEKQNKI